MSLHRKTKLTWCTLRFFRSQVLCTPSRGVFSQTGHWDHEFNQDVRREVESYWKPRLKEYDWQNRSQLTSEIKDKTPSKKEKFYVLSMFPYPSGSLHMGHVRVYTISDVMARYNRLRGKEVIHPMGWDAFGLPAENAAILRGEIPQKWTQKNIENMKKQLEDLGCSFDWNRELATCDPAYYKWTQYIFLKMYEAGLVYRKKAEVNWDPVDQTVLADEQISEDGLSWRSGAKVEKKYLNQWYIKTTSYSKSLLDGLDDVNVDLWRDIIDQQKHWIGELMYPIYLQYKVDDVIQDGRLTVRISNLESIYGISHITLAANHQLATFRNDDEYCQNSDFSGSNLCAVHPFTKENIPIFFAKKKLEIEDTIQDANIAIPSVCDEDKEDADSLSVRWNNILDEDNKLINSSQLSGLERKEAFQMVLNQLKKENVIGEPTSKKLGDWLISRQRYWGTPIPIIHCPECKTVPVDSHDLPVILPEIKRLASKGSSVLSQIDEWLNVNCPRCGGAAHRETDTMDTFVDSSWYFLRYLDVNNKDLPVDRVIADKYMPVDLYIGGKEHAVLHLYFARFFNHFLSDIGFNKHREPFIDLLTQGMVMGQSYKVKATGQYLAPEEVEISGKKAFKKNTGEVVELQWEKMSKSKYNGVDPQEVIEEYGVDSTRLCILSNVSPVSNRHWSNTEYKGVLRWQYRIWNLIGEYLKHSKQDAPMTSTDEEITKWQNELFEARNFILKEVTFHFKKTYLLSVAISRLQNLTNILKKCPVGIMNNTEEFERSVAELVIMISPFTPMFASELWSGLSSSVKHTRQLFHWDKSVLDQEWPVIDENYQYEMIIKCNNRDWGEIKLPVGRLNTLTTEEALEILNTNTDFMEYCKDRVILDSQLLIHKNYRAQLDISSKYTGERQKKRNV